VINLYSSAIFIAWGAVGLSIGLELVYRNGIGTPVGAIIGFCSLLIAQALSIEGDTMAQSGPCSTLISWLATHVVVITLGYASTSWRETLLFAYIILGLFTPLLANTEARKTMARMIYGIVCHSPCSSALSGRSWAGILRRFDPMGPNSLGPGDPQATQTGAIPDRSLNAIILHDPLGRARPTSAAWQCSPWWATS